MGKRALSGLKATGTPTLGNYLGAVKRWASNQDQYQDNLYFVPDLHALNSRPHPDNMRQDSYSAVATLLAAGVDPDRAVIYLQSSVPAHSELFNILNNYVTMGELSRQTQYKEKRQAAGEVVGLFEYPVLMAADILLYDVDEVPVGEDQRQHVELARDIAERFNNAHGDTFKPPRAVMPEVAARVMDLQEPTKKMSKSESSKGFVLITDTDEAIRDKFKQATTDSDREVVADQQAKPGITNLLNIMAACSDQSISKLEATYQGATYNEFKSDVAEAVLEVVKPVRDRYKELVENTAELEKILRTGQQRASQMATSKLNEVKKKVGLVTL